MVDPTGFSTLAGHRVLDLMNTVDWRLNPEQRSDRLTDPRDAWDWGLQFDYLTDHEHHLLAKDTNTSKEPLEAVLSLREHAYDALFDEDTGDRARHQLDTVFQEATSSCVLVRTPSGWTQADTHLSTRTLLHRIARDVMTFATTTPATSLGQCADNACGWVYLDTSPRHNRLWCSSASCGNRNRARRHYQRSRN